MVCDVFDEGRLKERVINVAGKKRLLEARSSKLEARKKLAELSAPSLSLSDSAAHL